jgi:hypothetical protein
MCERFRSLGALDWLADELTVHYWVEPLLLEKGKHCHEIFVPLRFEELFQEHKTEFVFLDLAGVTKTLNLDWD